MLERLRVVLDAVRYDRQSRPNERINLLFSLKVHALHRKDEEMVDACDAEIAAVQAEKAAAAAAAPVVSPANAIGEGATPKVIAEGPPETVFSRKDLPP